MGWNGSGTHTRVHNFSADASAGIQAQAVRFDAEFDDISTALENCQTLTGETTPTANSPMGGFKHTGVAAATSTDNYLRADQHSNQVGIFVRDVNTGVTGTMSASASPFPTSLTEGQRITVKVSANGSATAPRAIVVNGLSANIIDNAGSAIPASKMLKDGYFDLIYDASASAFRMITPRNDSDLLSKSDSFIAHASAGSFSVTLTGMQTAVSTSVDYEITGNLVTLYVGYAGAAGTASGSTFTATGLPAAVVPTKKVQVACPIRDNSQDKLGDCGISSAGSIISFRLPKSASSAELTTTAFTSGNDKGLTPGWTITYRK